MVAVDKTEFLWCAPLKSVFLTSSEVLYVEVLFTTQYRLRNADNTAQKMKFSIKKFFSKCD